MSQLVGKIIELYITNQKTNLRDKTNRCKLDKMGIINDKYYNKDIERSILITSLDSYSLLSEYSITLNYGLLGENLLIDYNPYSLTPGTKLKIGSIILEITQKCTICTHLSSIDKKIPNLLKNDRGIFAKVIKAGEINQNDKIFILKK